MKAALRFLLVLTVSACASTGSGTTSSSDRNRITTEQLAQVQADNAYDAIRRLQPQWLDARGPASVSNATPVTATVFVDGSRAGDLEYLRSVPLTSVAEIRYYTPGEAGNRFGMGLPRGAIELVSKGARR